MGNDRRRFQSLVDTKSTSRIRVNKKQKKEPTQLQVLEFLQVNYYNDILEIVITIKDNINEHNINSILDKYRGIMSDKRIILIKKFLLEKIKLMTRQFNL